MSKSRIYKKRLIYVFTLMLFFAPLTMNAAEGESSTEDAIADAVSWVALILAPIVGITVFLLVHILPEKIAEKKNHPQAAAIKTLCFLSLAFGGILWPLAWIWAYTKPVFYKMAYGTDQGDYHEETMKEFKDSKKKKKEIDDEVSDI